MDSQTKELVITLPDNSAGGGGLVTKSCPTLVSPWTGACQAPLSMGFFRQEYWSGLPFLFQGRKNSGATKLSLKNSISVI